MDESELVEIEQVLNSTTQGSWKFPGWKEELLEGESYGELVRHCWVPELDELGETGIQHSNEAVDWHDWDFIIRAHDEFVPELIAEVRRLNEIIGKYEQDQNYSIK